MKTIFGGVSANARGNARLQHDITAARRTQVHPLGIVCLSGKGSFGRESIIVLLASPKGYSRDELVDHLAAKLAQLFEATCVIEG